MTDRTLQPASEADLKEIQSFLNDRKSNNWSTAGVMDKQVQALLDLIDFQKGIIRDLQDESAAYGLGIIEGIAAGVRDTSANKNETDDLLRQAGLVQEEFR